MKYTDPNKARELLMQADVFYDYDIEDDLPEEQQYKQTLNMNDVWGWATACGEDVPDDKLCEVAELFWSYGWAGILYWVSERNNGRRSEFPDVNRAIDFVRHEERHKKEVPDDTKRAYTPITYTLG